MTRHSNYLRGWRAGGSSYQRAKRSLELLERELARLPPDGAGLCEAIQRHDKRKTELPRLLREARARFNKGARKVGQPEIEDDEMRNVEPVTPTTAAPHDGWILVARRRYVADQVYDVGCEVPLSALGKNFPALVSSGHLAWVPPGTAISVKPRDLPIAKPAPECPPVVIIDDIDIVVSARKTRQRLADVVGTARAMDAIYSDPEARSLWLRASNEHQRRQRKLHPGSISLPPYAEPL